MARKNAPTILQEELYPPSEQAVREELDDARLRDLNAEQESPFLRGQKRVSARRGTLPRKTANRLAWIAASAIVVFLCVVGVAALYHYGERSWRFRIDSSDDIEVNGMQNVTRAQIMEVMGGDIGRNIFFIPLAQRKTQLEQIPWVESASVMRFVPNHLRIEIHERTPVAFARIGSKILLIDSVGTLMDLPPKKKYSFPVVIGMNPGEPLSTRLARMKIYNEVVRQLDSGGARYSQELSEIDLSDAEDIKVLANNPEGEVLVHLGTSNYLERYKIYVSHVQQWRQQFQKLESVDLRYDRQIIVNPDMEGAPKQAPLTVAAAKKAMAAGVKPAALITGKVYGPRPLAEPKPAGPKKLNKSARLRRAKSRTRARAAAHPASKQSQPALASKKPSPSIARQQN